MLQVSAQELPRRPPAAPAPPRCAAAPAAPRRRRDGAPAPFAGWSRREAAARPRRSPRETLPRQHRRRGGGGRNDVVGRGAGARPGGGAGSPLRAPRERGFAKGVRAGPPHPCRSGGRAGGAAGRAGAEGWCHPLFQGRAGPVRGRRWARRRGSLRSGRGGGCARCQPLTAPSPRVPTSAAPGRARLSGLRARGGGRSLRAAAAGRGAGSGEGTPLRAGVPVVGPNPGQECPAWVSTPGRGPGSPRCGSQPRAGVSSGVPAVGPSPGQGSRGSPLWVLALAGSPIAPASPGGAPAAGRRAERNFGSGTAGRDYRGKSPWCSPAPGAAGSCRWRGTRSAPAQLAADSRGRRVGGCAGASEHIGEPGCGEWRAAKASAHTAVLKMCAGGLLEKPNGLQLSVSVTHLLFPNWSDKP